MLVVADAGTNIKYLACGPLCRFVRVSIIEAPCIVALSMSVCDPPTHQDSAAGLLHTREVARPVAGLAKMHHSCISPGRRAGGRGVVNS